MAVSAIGTPLSKGSVRWNREISSRFAFVYNYRYTDSSQSVYPKTTWYSWLEKRGWKGHSAERAVFSLAPSYYDIFSHRQTKLWHFCISIIQLGEVSQPTVRTWLRSLFLKLKSFFVFSTIKVTKVFLLTVIQNFVTISICESIATGAFSEALWQ